jgi:hypothetical protein
MIAFFLFTFLWAAPAFAQGNLTWGKLKGKVGLEYQLEFNDNIFSEPDNEQDDIIHHIIPMIELGYENEGRPGNYFFIGYKVDIARYVDFDLNDYERHAPYLSFGLKSAKGLYLTASDQFLKTDDPYGSLNQYGVGVKTKRYSNDANILLGYEFFKRYAVEAFYNNYFIRYDEGADKWQDRTDNRVGGNLVYNVTPRTGLFLQYNYLDASYDEQDNGVFDPGRGAFWSSDTSQDYEINAFLLGARFKPGGKLEGQISLGYGTKEYKNLFDIDGNKYEDVGDWVAQTLAGWQARERTKFTFELRRSFEGSPDADASGYIDTKLSLMWDQQMAHRLSFKLAGRWNANNYEDVTAGQPDKFFNIYTVWTVLKWNIKRWLYIGIDYEFTSKQATESFYDGQTYDRHQTRLLVGGTY